MKTSFSRLRTSVFVLLLTSLVGCKAQRPEKRGQEEIPVTETLNANDHEKIRAAVGRIVAVRGKVHRVGGTSAGGVYFIIFQGNQRGQFVGIVKEENLAAVTKTLGAELKVALTSKAIELRGKMELYKDNTPQIVVEGANQIQLMKE